MTVLGTWNRPFRNAQLRAKTAENSFGVFRSSLTITYDEYGSWKSDLTSVTKDQ